MRKQKDEVRATFEFKRKIAIGLVKAWAEDMLKDYQEPVWAGKKLYKGEKVGFPRHKMKAAFLQVLYPALNLDEIAQIVGVSGNLLRLWRTEEEFQKVSEAAVDRFWKWLINTIEMRVESKNIDDPSYKRFFKKEPVASSMMLGIEGREEEEIELSGAYLVCLIYFFNPKGRDHFVEFIEKKMKIGSDFLLYHPAIEFWLEALHVKDLRSLRNWIRDPKILNLKKEYIRMQISALNDPRYRKAWGKKGTAEVVEALKMYVWNLIDDLAK